MRLALGSFPVSFRVRVVQDCAMTISFDHDQFMSSNELLNRLAEVTAMLHHEQGDREQLEKERIRLMSLARQVGLFKQESRS